MAQSDLAIFLTTRRCAVKRDRWTCTAMNKLPEAAVAASRASMLLTSEYVTQNASSLGL